MKGLLLYLLAISGIATGFQTSVAVPLKLFFQPSSSPLTPTISTTRLVSRTKNLWYSAKKHQSTTYLESSKSLNVNGNGKQQRKVGNLIDKDSLNTIASASAFVAMDLVFQRAFSMAHLSFPPSLAGCAALLTVLLTLPRKQADQLYDKLTPGANLFAKFLPVLFVPSLITLPLALSDHAGSAQELLKLAVVVVGGFCVTLLTTAYSVVWVRKLGKEQSNRDNQLQTYARDAESQGRGLLQDAKDALEETVETNLNALSEAASDVTSGRVDIPTSQATPKAFSDDFVRNLLGLTASSGLAALVTSLMGFSKLTVVRPLTSLFLLATTLSSFCIGARLPASITKLVHPLVTCTSLTWSAAILFASLTNQSFVKLLKLYRTGSLQPLRAGAGDVLLFLLGPAVVSLAISMYSRRQLIRDNVREVGTAVGVSTVGGLFGTALAVRWLDIASPYLRLSLLSRNITSPLAMAIASILGADISFAVSIVVVTGLIGANFGASLLDWAGLKDPVARGLGIGAAAHGLGTAAFAKEKDAFPFAAIGMALTASAATVAVSIPLLRKIILQLALG